MNLTKPKKCCNRFYTYQQKCCGVLRGSAENAMGFLHLAAIKTAQADIAAALEHSGQALGTLRSLGETVRSLPSLFLDHAELLVSLGNKANARKIISEIIDSEAELIDTVEGRNSLAYAYRLSAKIYLTEQNPEVARAEYALSPKCYWA